MFFRGRQPEASIWRRFRVSSDGFTFAENDDHFTAHVVANAERVVDLFYTLAEQLPPAVDVVIDDLRSGRSWKAEMFPDPDLWKRYEERAVRKYPQMGDISCRSALTVHRGTPHPSPIARPVLVLGVDAPGAGHAALHDMMVTRDYYAAVPEEARRHLACRVVDQLVPITQKHDIEGLVMG